MGNRASEAKKGANRRRIPLKSDDGIMTGDFLDYQGCPGVSTAASMITYQNGSSASEAPIVKVEPGPQGSVGKLYEIVILDHLL